MLEGPWQTIVEGIATRYGWLWYHTPAWKPTGKRPAPGFPDLVLTKGTRMIFAELKSSDPKSKPTAKQVEWLRAAEAAGNEVALWRPEDQPLVISVLGLGRRAVLPQWFPKVA